jgi:hypothetical protein
MRCENKLAKAPNIVIYSAGRVGMSNLLAECLPELTLLFVNSQMDKV